MLDATLEYPKNPTPDDHLAYLDSASKDDWIMDIVENAELQ